MPAFDPLTAIFEAGKIAIERIWPDPIRRAEELRKLEELKQTGQLAELNARVQILLGQIEVNKIEAQHKSLFVAGWRPAIGWTCAISLGLAYIPKTLMITVIWSMQAIMILKDAEDIANVQIPVFPDLGLSDIIGLLISLLGVGIMRSVDKKNRVQTDSLSPSTVQNFGEDI